MSEQPPGKEPPHSHLKGADLLSSLLVGVLPALLPVAYGVKCMWTKTASIPGKNRWFEVFGADAILIGISYIALGGLMHFSWFWGYYDRYHAISERGKMISLLILAPSFCYVVFRHVLNFWF